MDWFKNSLQLAQKQAQEAAEKAKALAQQASQQARVLAEQASEQAKVLAEQASEQAKVLAEQASEQAKAFAEQASEKAKQASEKAKVFAAAAAEEAQAKLQQLATQGITGSSSADADPSELAKYGVTPGLLETICGMTYSTFSDYPLELLPTTNPMGLTPPIPSPGFRLSPWQERHALLVLSKGDQLQGLRFALCPKIMSEELFWIIYFTLVKTLLPPEAFKSDAEETPPRRSPSKSSISAGAARTNSGSMAAADVRAATTPALPISTSVPAPGSASAAGSGKRHAAAATTAAATPLSASKGAQGAAAASPSPPGGASEGRVSLVGDEAVLVDVGSSSNADVGSSSNAGDHADEDDDVGGVDDEDVDGEADGGEADLDALEDDPELAAYLQEALDVAEGGEGDGEGLSDLGSATDDDLDDYINQLDAELGPDREGASPAKSEKDG